MRKLLTILLFVPCLSSAQKEKTYKVELTMTELQQIAAHLAVSETLSAKQVSVMLKRLNEQIAQQDTSKKK